MVARDTTAVPAARADPAAVHGSAAGRGRVRRAWPAPRLAAALAALAGLLNLVSALLPAEADRLRVLDRAGSGCRVGWGLPPPPLPLASACCCWPAGCGAASGWPGWPPLGLLGGSVVLQRHQGPGCRGGVGGGVSDRVAGQPGRPFHRPPRPTGAPGRVTPGAAGGAVHRLLLRARVAGQRRRHRCAPDRGPGGARDRPHGGRARLRGLGWRAGSAGSSRRRWRPSSTSAPWWWSPACSPLPWSGRSATPGWPRPWPPPVTRWPTSPSATIG